MNVEMSSVSRSATHGCAYGLAVCICVFVTARAHAASEVWIGYGSGIANNTIGRLDFNRNPLTPNYSSPLSQTGVTAIVGDKVWIGYGAGIANNTIGRMDFDGNALTSYTASINRVGAMAVVDDEVWIGYGAGVANNTIGRMDFGGNALPSMTAPINQVGVITVVGNEVWMGYGSGIANNTIGRMDFNGNVLTPNYSCPLAQTGLMVVVGNEVWFGFGPGIANNAIARTDFAGNSAGSHTNPINRTGAMAVVGNEVWIGYGAGVANNTIGRLDHFGVSQGTFTGPINQTGVFTVLDQPDCNGNGAGDLDDIQGPTSEDCNTNLLPDECEIDLNSTAPGGPFFCATGCASDCNNNGIPDACDTDCNTNDVPDDCDLAGPTSADCNGNSVPDECDIAGLTSVDCNTNSVPDTCDLAGATSDDCDANTVPDECDPGSGDHLWSGPDGASFTAAGNWTPASVPGFAGNAILTNTQPADNRCSLSEPGTTRVCMVAVSATGSGRQVLEIRAASRLLTNESTTIQTGGDIVLSGGELAGGSVTNTSNSLSGYGIVSADLHNSGLVAGEFAQVLSFTGVVFDNQTTGTLRAPITSRIRVRSFDVSQQGEIEVRSQAAVAFDVGLTNASDGELTLLGGTLDADGLANAVGASLYGFGTIDTDVTNYGSIVIIADTQVIGNLVNEGTITIQGGNLTVVGDLSGSGVIIGGVGG